jgi:hypothetical protein
MFAQVAIISAERRCVSYFLFTSASDLRAHENEIQKVESFTVMLDIDEASGDAGADLTIVAYQYVKDGATLVRWNNLHGVFHDLMSGYDDLVETEDAIEMTHEEIANFFHEISDSSSAAV